MLGVSAIKDGCFGAI